MSVAAVSDIQAKRRSGASVPIGFRRCTKKSCTWCIHESNPLKRCTHCRARVKRWSETATGKDSIRKSRTSEGGKLSAAKATKKFRLTEKGQACTKRANAKDRSVEKANWRKFTEKGKAYVKRNAQSDATKASLKKRRKTVKYKAMRKRFQLTEKGKACNHRAQTNEKGKARRRRYNRKLMNQLTNSLYHMVAGKHQNPVTFPKMGIFTNNDDARQHFQRHFAPWMSFSNQGKYTTGMAYNVKWQIGHGIPKAAYDPTNDDDLQKCWSRDNLRPQCARENNEMRDKLPSCDWLNARLHLWPASWMGILPAERL